MALLLSLAAAVSYGLSDFIGGVASQRVTPWTIALVGQIAGSLPFLVAGLLGDGSFGPAVLGWSVLAGLGNGLGTAFLYRGLSSGRMGVVAPVSGVGAALLPIAVGLVTGERPSMLVWLGIVAAIPAIWLVAREPVTGSATGGTGLTDGVLAGVGFGTLFSALAQIPESAGLVPLALNQLVAAAVIVLVATLLRAPWVPRRPAALLGAVSGCLGAAATALFLVSSRDGGLTVAAVITSLYPAFTVLLALSVLRERVHRAQAVGLSLCAVTVVLVALG
ncbi:DMT family transporter [Nocardioides sp. cx-173]|uniref:DMT family transporter n=1 Tax=Nocardioides sp. cx-173 TaxID=2898796 RepID=UPI001E62E78D|nr:DMT family transporter [Nocardioides sp. cx-173]MCD4527309.1 DMT family transporter [Nocardioides sp. cx-173]UGB43608.1 DMT family transporter [Nocardioides sp. cx-173]